MACPSVVLSFLVSRARLKKSKHDALDDPEQVEGAARAAVDARHHQHVAGVELVEDAAQLRPSPCRDKSAACAANGKGAAAHILLTAWPFLEE
jgi:hypothetical protein